MIGFTRNLAVEVGQFNITVNIVSPGLTLTEEVKAMLTPKLKRNMRNKSRCVVLALSKILPMLRCFLLRAGEFYTGHYLPVCGGQVME